MQWETANDCRPSPEDAKINAQERQTTPRKVEVPLPSAQNHSGPAPTPITSADFCATRSGTSAAGDGQGGQGTARAGSGACCAAEASSDRVNRATGARFCEFGALQWQLHWQLPLSTTQVVRNVV